MRSRLTKFGRLKIGASAFTVVVGGSLPFALPVFQSAASAGSLPQGSAALVCTPTASNFGDATPFTDYVAGNAYFGNGSTSYIQDTEGAVAVGGSVDFTVAPGKSYSVGIGLSGSYSSRPGILGDSLIAPNGTGNVIIHSGNVHVGSGVGQITNNGSGTIYRNATVTSPLNFATTTSFLQHESSAVYADPQQYGSYNFNSSTHVLTISSSALSGQVGIVDVPAVAFQHQGLTVTVNSSGGSVVINVIGSSSSVDLTDVTTVNASRTYTLWNFGPATVVALNKSVQWRGTILAPYALFTGAAQIEGSIYVHELASIAETHLDIYRGCVPTSLYISKTSNPGNIASGQSSSYTINTAAIGGVAGTVKLSDPLMYAPGVDYVIVSDRVTSSSQVPWSSCSITEPTPNTPGGLLCGVLTNGLGVSDPVFAPVVIGVRTSNFTPLTHLLNTATLSYQTQSASASAQIMVTPPPPTLSLNKTVDGVTQITLPAPSLNNNYQLVAQGSGVFQHPIMIGDHLPTYLGLSYGTPVVSNVAQGLTENGCTLNSSSNTVFCEFTPQGSYLYLPSTQSLATITVPFALSSQATLAGSFSNQANIGYGESPSVASNTVVVNVNDPTLSIVKTVNGTSSVTVTPPSTNNTFTLVPSGSGTFNTSLVVSDYLPSYAGLTYGTPQISGLNSVFTSSSTSCTTPTPGAIMTCTFPLASGSSFVQIPSTTNLVTINIPFALSSTASPGSFTNGGSGSTGTSVSSTGSTASSNVVTVNVNATTPVAPSHQLSVQLTKVATNSSVQPGANDSFTITGSFTGVVASTVTVTDPMPNYVTLSGMPTVSGSSFASSTCSATSNVVNCTFTPPSGGLTNPTIGSITVPVTVSSSAPSGQITNTATLSDSGDGLSPVTASATITVTVPQTTTPTTTVSSSGGGTQVAPQVSASSTVTVPAVHTGEPWSSRYWYLLVELSAILGLSLLMPWRKLRFRRK